MQFERKNKTLKERLLNWWQHFLCHKEIHYWEYYDKNIFKDIWLFERQQLRKCQVCNLYQISEDGKHWESIIERVSSSRCKDFKPRFFKRNLCRLWRKCRNSRNSLGCEGYYKNITISSDLLKNSGGSDIFSHDEVIQEDDTE